MDITFPVSHGPIERVLVVKSAWLSVCHFPMPKRRCNTLPSAVSNDPSSAGLRLPCSLPSVVQTGAYYRSCCGGRQPRVLFPGELSNPHGRQLTSGCHKTG